MEFTWGKAGIDLNACRVRNEPCLVGKVNNNWDSYTMKFYDRDLEWGEMYNNAKEVNARLLSSIELQYIIEEKKKELTPVLKRRCSHC